MRPVTRLAGRAAFAAACGICLAGAAAGGELEVIYTEVPGDPTSIVPGAVDLAGTPIVTQFRAIEVLTMSPDGTQWILKARNEAGSDLETMMLKGSGTVGAVFAQEGQPVHDGVAGELYEFFGSSPATFNELGQFVYTARARNGDPTIKQKGILFDGVSYHVVRQESDPALGLLDLPPNPSGDELFGNSFGSMHLLNDGTIGYQDSSITMIHTSRRPAIFYDDTAFMQSGVTPIDGSTWDSFDSNEFWTTPDGATWIAAGDDEGATTQDKIFVASGSVVMREGQAIDGSGVVFTDVFHTKLLANGGWFARGDDPSNNDWAVRSGELLTYTGQPITTGAAELWGDAFYAFTGNQLGDWVLAGNTDNADTQIDSVIVLNGTEVVVREGDPVDLDGNGMFDDDVFIGRGTSTLTAFNANDIFLTDDGVLYFLAPLRNAAGGDLAMTGAGDAFLRLVLGAPCPADIDGNGSVDVDDLTAVILGWGGSGPADIDGSGVVDVDDLTAVILGWGGCP